MDTFKALDWKKFSRTDEVDPRTISAWIKSTKWDKFMKGKDAAKLRELSVYPEDNEFPGLRDLVQDYADAALAEMEDLGENTLRRLNTSKPEEGLDNNPFRRPQQDTTIGNYMSINVRLVASLLRTSDHFQYPLTSRQQASIAKLRELIVAGISDNKDDALNALHELFISLWHVEYHTRNHSGFNNPTMCFLVMYAIKSDGRFEDPKQLTRPLRHLIFYLTLVTIRQLTGLLTLPDIQFEPDALKHVDIYIREGTETTFNSLWSLQHRASKIAFKSFGEPVYSWPNRGDFTTLSFKGEIISLKHINTIISNLQEKIMTIWHKDICFGYDVRVDYEFIADNLADANTYQSYLDRPQNPFASKRFELISILVNDPILSAKYLRTTADNKIVFKASFVQQWLKSLAELELYLIILFQFTSGAPARFTEISSTLVRNTPYMKRNVFAIGKQLAMIIHYTKTSHNKGLDSIIPHCFCAFTADMFNNLHALARPFAQCLVHVAVPDSDNLVVKYGTLAFMGNQAEISEKSYAFVFENVTSDVLGKRLMPSHYRHVAIIYGRKHCDTLEGLEEVMNEEESARALQSGHSRATERRIYGIESESIGPNDYNMIQRMLDVSISFQLLYRAVPGGGNKWLRFQDAVTSQFEYILSTDYLPVHLRPKLLTETTGITAEQLDATISPMRDALHVMADGMAELRKGIATLSANLVNPSATPSHPLPAVPTRVAQITPPTSGSSIPRPRHVIRADSSFASIASVLPAKHRAIEDTASSSPLSSPKKRKISPAKFFESPLKKSRAAGKSAHQHMPREMPSTPTRKPGSSTRPASIVTYTPGGSLDDLFNEPVPAHSPSIDSGLGNSHSRPDNEIVPPVEYIPIISHDISALDIVRSLLKNPDATWRTVEQREATRIIHEGKVDLIFAARTASGKSLPLLINVRANGGICIMIFPLRSLTGDWVRKCIAMGIDFEIYDTKTKQFPTGRASLIFVSADQSVTKAFQTLIKQLCVGDRILRWIAIDEAHFWFFDSKFRANVFGKLARMRFEPCPIILLSATMPPPAIPVMIQRAGLHPDTKVIRTSIVRPQIKLGIVDGIDLMDKSIPKFIRLMDSLFLKAGGKKDTDRVIIYCQSITDIHTICRKLGKALDMVIPAYFTGTKDIKMTPEEQQASLDKWRSGASHIIVCSSAFSAGIDEPNVRIVLHYGAVRDFMDLVQEQDRAGRSGENAFAYVITSQFRPTVKVTPEAAAWGEDIRGRSALDQLLYVNKKTLPEACINYARTTIFDGVGLTCSQLQQLRSENICTRCEELNKTLGAAALVPTTPIPETSGEDLILTIEDPLVVKDRFHATFGDLCEAARNIIVDQIAGDNERIAMYREGLTRFKEICTLCWAINNVEEKHDLWRKCRVLSKNRADNIAFLKLLKGPSVRFETFVCFTCHIVPTNLGLLHPDPGDDCPFQADLMGGLNLALWTSDIHRANFIQFAGIKDWKTVDDFTEWYCKEDTNYETKSMQILTYFIQYDKQNRGEYDG